MCGCPTSFTGWAEIGRARRFLCFETHAPGFGQRSLRGAFAAGNGRSLSLDGLRVYQAGSGDLHAVLLVRGNKKELQG